MGWAVKVKSCALSAAIALMVLGNRNLAAQPLIASADLATTSAAQVLLTTEFGPKLVASRYMEKNCTPVTWPGYEGLPTQLCRYTVTDKATSQTKQAAVVLLDPPPEMVATWVVNAEPLTSGGLVSVERGRKLFKHIISQSGGQFPVAGVVYEDMEGDGFMKAYCFRDGVTVRVDGVEHRTTAPLTEAELDAALHGRVTRVYTYARIASTSPNDYKAAGGTVDVGDNTERKPAWLDVVRQATVRAWRTGHNDLMEAWLKGHPDF